VRVRVFSGKLFGQDVQGRFGLLWIDARFKPPRNKQIVAVAGVEPGATGLDPRSHHHWHPNVWSEHQFDATETFWRHSNHGKGVPVSNNGWPTIPESPPNRICQQSWLKTT